MVMIKKTSVAVLNYSRNTVAFTFHLRFEYEIKQDDCTKPSKVY